MKLKKVLTWTFGTLGVLTVSVAGFIGLVAYRLSPGIETSSIAPDITLTDPSGDEVLLSSFRGDLVLLDFWNST